MTIRTMLGLSPESTLLIGEPDQQLRARNEWQRAKNAEGIRARWDEIPSERLVFTPRWIEDTETGNLYREFGGDPAYAETVCAYYVRDDGYPIMLELADPPSRAEIEKRRAARERRRLAREEARKARYDELRRSR